MPIQGNGPRGPYSTRPQGQQGTRSLGLGSGDDDTVWG